MLVGKDHLGGEGSCWSGRIMLLLQDGKLLQKYDFPFCTNKINFGTEQTPVCPFATYIAANYMTSRRAPFPSTLSNSTREKPHVKVTSKTYFLGKARDAQILQSGPI